MLSSGRDLFFAWFNLGSSLVSLEKYPEAAQAFDQAFAVYANLPETRAPLAGAVVPRRAVRRLLSHRSLPGCDQPGKHDPVLPQRADIGGDAVLARPGKGSQQETCRALSPTTSGRCASTRHLPVRRLSSSDWVWLRLSSTPTN